MLKSHNATVITKFWFQPKFKIVILPSPYPMLNEIFYLVNDPFRITRMEILIAGKSVIVFLAD